MGKLGGEEGCEAIQVHAGGCGNTCKNLLNFSIPIFIILQREYLIKSHIERAFLLFVMLINLASHPVTLFFLTCFAFPNNILAFFRKLVCCVFQPANQCSACSRLVEIKFLMPKQLFLSITEENIEKRKQNCSKEGSTSVKVLLLNAG